MNRRDFFKSLIVVTTAQIFVPKIIQVTWHRLPKNEPFSYFIVPIIKNIFNKEQTTTSICSDYDWMDTKGGLSFPVDLVTLERKYCIIY